MTKELGKIAKLKTSIDTLSFITSAIDNIHAEIGLNWNENPGKVLKKARERLDELKKK